MILPLKKNAHLEEARSCINNKNVTEVCIKVIQKITSQGNSKKKGWGIAPNKTEGKRKKKKELMKV